jgi:hypothetical protein
LGCGRFPPWNISERYECFSGKLYFLFYQGKKTPHEAEFGKDYYDRSIARYHLSADILTDVFCLLTYWKNAGNATKKATQMIYSMPLMWV